MPPSPETLGMPIKLMDAQGEEGIESGLVDGVGLSKASGDGLFEDGEVVVVDRIEALFFDELPKPLDEVEIGGISRQEKKLDAKGEGKIPDQPAFLITGVVKNEGNGHGEAQSANTEPALMWVSLVTMMSSWVTALSAPSTLKR